MGVVYSEITEQYQALKRTMYYLDRECTGLPELHSKHVVVIGCGSCYSLAKSMSMMIQMKTGLLSVALAGGDLLLHVERYLRMIQGCVLVALSPTGATGEIILSIDLLKAMKCSFTLVSLTCSKDSCLAEISDYALEMPWAFDRNVCQTGSVSNLYFAFSYAMASVLKDYRLLSDLKLVVEHGPAFLHKVESLSTSIAAMPWTNGVVLGDAELSGLCEEAALSFKEICQMPSNYYPLLDARHGPMTLFDDETLILAVLGSDSRYELDFFRDVLAAGSTVVLFTAGDVRSLEGVHTISFSHPLCHIARGLPFLLFCQLVVYYKSFHSGSNPDTLLGLKTLASK